MKTLARVHYQHTVTATGEEWLKIARGLLEQRQPVLILDVTEHTLADCITLAHEYNCQYIHELGQQNPRLSNTFAVGLQPKGQ